MANSVVPFGKYKGQPVEAMQADRGYIDWLLAQPWFKEQHQNIYTLIINNFVRVHGDAMCRGWAAAAARMKEEERRRDEKAAADRAAYLAREEEIKKEMVRAQARSDEQRQIDQAKAVFPGATVTSIREKQRD